MNQLSKARFFFFFFNIKQKVSSNRQRLQTFFNSLRILLNYYTIQHATNSHSQTAATFFFQFVSAVTIFFTKYLKYILLFIQLVYSRFIHHFVTVPFPEMDRSGSIIRKLILFIILRCVAASGWLAQEVCAKPVAIIKGVVDFTSTHR